MASQIPPLLESARVTYLKAIGTILPALCIWIFANIFLLPKLQWLWERTNLTGSKAQWLMDVSYFLSNNIRVVFGFVALLLVVLELRVRAWPKYRRTVVSVLVVVIHTVVLLALASIATLVLLAAPLLTKTK